MLFVKHAVTRYSTRSVRHNVPRGCVYIKTTFNNTIITVTDAQGNVLRWATSGAVGFKGTRKSTPFAARLAAEKAANEAVSNDGMREVDVFVNGAGPGREASLRAIACCWVAGSFNCRYNTHSA